MPHHVPFKNSPNGNEILVRVREDYIMLNRQNNRVYNCTLNSFGSTLMICLNVSPSSNPEEPATEASNQGKEEEKSKVTRRHGTLN